MKTHSSSPLLQVTNLQKTYVKKSLLGHPKSVQALRGVSFNLYPGETLGLVGESGCGKSTLAKVLMQLESPTSGEYLIKGKSAGHFSKKDFYHTIQMVFQDPMGSLNPRKRAWEIIAEPLFINTSNSKKECRNLALELMERVGLGPDQADRFPHMFSGGQRQRIGLARALVLRPSVLICDEPVSALDVSIQAQVLNLLKDLQVEYNLSTLFISHDLSVVRHMASTVMVMYLGEIVEMGPTEQVLKAPSHPYTEALLQATPSLHLDEEFEFKPIQGEVPSPLNPPSGCSFHTRCPKVQSKCLEAHPEWHIKSPQHKVSCHFSLR